MLTTLQPTEYRTSDMCRKKKKVGEENGSPVQLEAIIRKTFEIE